MLFHAFSCNEMLSKLSIQKAIYFNYVTDVFCLAELSLDDTDSGEEDQAEGEEAKAQPQVPMARETLFIV